MSRGAAAHTEVVAGAAAACFAVITDWESYPDWQSAVRSCTVLDRCPQGRWDLVETVVDAKVRGVRYVLRYHLEAPHRIWWEYVDGDVRSISGSYELEEGSDGTTQLHYRLEIDAGMFVPGPVRRFLTETAMRTSVREVKARVERAAP